VVMEGKTQLEAVLTLESGPNISTARNKLCDRFLRDQAAPWLFMCDTDMVLPAGGLDRLIDAADPVERPGVGGLGFSLEGGRQQPRMYEVAEQGERLAFRRHTAWEAGSVVRVSATGAACLLIHRDALKAVRKRAADPAAPWFRESAFGAPLSLMGEDMTFCL